MNDLKDMALSGALPLSKEDAKALAEEVKNSTGPNAARQEAAKKAQDMQDKNQFTEAFTPKGAAHGNF